MVVVESQHSLVSRSARAAISMPTRNALFPNSPSMMIEAGTYANDPAGRPSRRREAASLGPRRSARLTTRPICFIAVIGQPPTNHHRQGRNALR